MRMLLAIVCSTIFTFVYAALAAKRRRAEMVLIPLRNILQPVPILGFLTFTVVFFMNLFRAACSAPNFLPACAELPSSSARVALRSPC